jgi:hypothetical protein
MKTPRIIVVFALLVPILLAPHVASAESIGEPGRAADKPNPLKNVYFGEQHLHSENSPDAFAVGTRQKREDAFRYGRGPVEPFYVAVHEGPSPRWGIRFGISLLLPE